MMSFIAYLREQGIEVTHNLADRYDVIFTNHWSVPYTTLLRGLRRNKDLRLVHRIDGSAQDYGRDPQSDIGQSAVNLLADATLFQSRYARYATREKFPAISQDGPVIYNPVDTTLFTPEGNHYSALEGFIYQNRVCAATWSTNPKKGAESIYAVARANPDIGFVLCGNYQDAPALPNIRCLGVLGRTELAAAMRSCTVFLTFSENEACPNVVLEALATGLPVLYIDSGGTQELVEECGYPVETQSFRAKLDFMLTRRSELATMARKRAKREFSPTKVFGQYLQLIEDALDAPPQVPLEKRKQLAWNPQQVISYNSRLWARRTRTSGLAGRVMRSVS